MSASPGPEPRLGVYQRWLAETSGLRFADYDALWRWSVRDLDAFWRSVWDHFAVESPTPIQAVLAERRMPGARWFTGAQVNFTRQVLRHADAAHAGGHAAILFADETLLARGELRSVSWPTLRAQVASFASELKQLGVRRGDRVCAVLPHTPQTIAVFLAVASVGAIWSICSPDMGPAAVLDRFRQIEPKVLVACDGYHFGGVHHDRRAHVDALLEQLPSVRHTIRGPDVDAALARHRDAEFAPGWLPFDHPLWIVYSSGTTGLPKPIVHGHGGVMIEFLKSTLHNNLGASVETGDRFFWFSTTGWVMWHALLAGLLVGTTVCIFDGSPAAPSGVDADGRPSKAPDWTTLWRFAGLARCTFFGAGAAYFASCLKADLQPMAAADLSALRAVGSTGSPLSEECHDWIWQRCPKPGGRDIWIDAISGGTDLAGAFVGGNVMLPQRRGVMQCRWLGAAVEAWDEQGRSLVDQVGELVCTQPMPSMPLYFWNDPDGARYRDSYFDMYPGGDGKPAVWRHGDWIRITPDGGAIIYGRSDATINRHGVRMGTAELYRAVEALPEVLDSLVVDLEYLGRPSWMGLFVVLREGGTLDVATAARIKAAVRSGLSPRHVPDEVFQVPAIPRTLSGKKMELPVKKLLLGAAPDTVLKRDAMANADSVDWFVALARRRASSSKPSA